MLPGVSSARPNRVYACGMCGCLRMNQTDKQSFSLLTRGSKCPHSDPVVCLHDLLNVRGEDTDVTAGVRLDEDGWIPTMMRMVAMLGLTTSYV